jgi:hypothetical protein
VVPLAFNVVLPQTLKVRIQVAVAALPIGLMFLSFVPLFRFAHWLEQALGIPPNSPVKSHPNGVLWITVFLSVMVLLMVAGYLIGWVANALISRHILGWPTSKVAAVYLRSEVPSEWFKEAGATTPDAKRTPVTTRKWEDQRAKGPVRFILTRGVLAWGTPMFVAMYVAPTLVRGTGFSFSMTVFQGILWAFAGAAFGGAIWWLAEWNHRKQLKK